LKAKHGFSQQFVLTDEHTSMLDRKGPKFRSANPDNREKIVEEAADAIERTWAEDMEFDRDTVINVCEFFSNLGHSQAFLAYSPASVR
jgi:hypothetical protein